MFLGNTLRRCMSENRLSSFAIKALTGKENNFNHFLNSVSFKYIFIGSLTDGLTNIENRKRLQATRSLFMTIERRKVREALLLNKQNKEMQRLVYMHIFRKILLTLLLV